MGTRAHDLPYSEWVHNHRPSSTSGNSHKVLLVFYTYRTNLSNQAVSNTEMLLVEWLKSTRLKIKTEDLRRTYWSEGKSQAILQKMNCLNFHNMNRCHYLLVAVIQPGANRRFPIVGAKPFGGADVQRGKFWGKSCEKTKELPPGGTGWDGVVSGAPWICQ